MSSLKTTVHCLQCIVYDVFHEGGFGVKTAASLDLQYKAGTI